MARTRKHSNKEVYDFLEANSTDSFRHADIMGGRENVYLIPSNLKGDFLELYYGCLWNSVSAWVDWTDGDRNLLTKEVLTGDVDFREGDYYYVRMGCGRHECKEHIMFYTARIYGHRGRTIMETDYKDGKVVVCLV